MQRQSNYWSAWMAGWVSATKTILEAQQRALESFLPASRRAMQQTEASLPATAGDKPAVARRRGRPAKGGAATRRRGRPRKSAKS